MWMWMGMGIGIGIGIEMGRLTSTCLCRTGDEEMVRRLELSRTSMEHEPSVEMNIWSASGTYRMILSLFRGA